MQKHETPEQKVKPQTQPQSLDVRKGLFLDVFWNNITEQQRKDYEQAQEHFGPLYRVQDTNYFYQKFKEYEKGTWPKAREIRNQTD